jgi:hypothetical protein
MASPSYGRGAPGWPGAPKRVGRSSLAAPPRPAQAQSMQVRTFVSPRSCQARSRCGRWPRACAPPGPGFRRIASTVSPAASCRLCRRCWLVIPTSGRSALSEARVVLADPRQRSPRAMSDSPVLTPARGLFRPAPRSWRFATLIPVMDRLVYPAPKDRACARISVRPSGPRPGSRRRPADRPWRARVGGGSVGARIA